MILHFVYNVDGTPSAIANDFIQRLRDPEHYPCRLCDVTYGRFFKKSEWTRFVADLPIEARFHLRNSFHWRYPRLVAEPLPAVFVESARGELRTLISAEALSAAVDLSGLMELVTRSVGSLAQS